MRFRRCGFVPQMDVLSLRIVPAAGAVGGSSKRPRWSRRRRHRRRQSHRTGRMTTTPTI